MFSAASSLLAAHTLILSSAPLLRPALLRPRFGALPIVLGLFLLAWVLLLRYALPGWKRWMTRAALGLSLVLVLSWLPRAAVSPEWRQLLSPAYYSYVIVPTTAIQVTMLIGLLSAPLWVPLGRWARRRLRRMDEAAGRSAEPASPAVGTPSSSAASVAPAAELPAPTPEAAEPPSRLRLPSRRELIIAAPWVLPAGAALASTYGSLIESRRIVVRRVTMVIPELQPSLVGLRIGQVTDMHIARDLTQLHHLERGLGLLAGERLDLLVATGDLCDERSYYTDVLRLLNQVPTRLGSYGCLGNHELFVGLDVVERAYETTGMRLLAEDSVRLGALHLAGISYPTNGASPRMHMPGVPPLLQEALRERPSAAESTTILLSHHPHAIEHVVGHDVKLVISGHTHGGQIGLGQGTPIEPIYKNARGSYRYADPQTGAGPRTDTQLFVSSGLGHWLPCRINCPPEVVVIELLREAPKRA